MNAIKKTTRLSLLVLGSFFFITFITNCSQTSGETNDDAENPTGTKGLTVKELGAAVKEYIKEESSKNDGYFIVKDEKENKELKLKLKKVHEDKLTSLSSSLHFVCADFDNTDGVVYDIDIFMEGTEQDNLSATEVSVHKKDGKPRYTWYEEKGVWKKKDVEQETKKESEHPEHPEHPTEHPEHPK